MGLIVGWVGHDVLVSYRYQVKQSGPEKTKGVVDGGRSIPSKKKFTPLEIVEIDAKVTESNDVWWKYAWRLTVQNFSGEPISFNATIEFLDKDGFVVDDDDEYGLYLEYGQKKTFTGYDLIVSSVAPNIVSVTAKVGR
ncbi:MAG TPA: hypothetical protein VNL73_01020 [Verrucomicrobiae bacterium]|nr:hypothetical protein [Verrucomicrobiae bacterium]